MNDIHPTPKELEEIRQVSIESGEICTKKFCDYPQRAEMEGWCCNCGRPITQETKKSWEGFLFIDSRHKAFVEAFLAS